MNQTMTDKNKIALNTLVGSLFTRRMLERIDYRSRKSILNRFIEICADQHRKYKSNPAHTIRIDSLAAGTRSIGDIEAKIKMPSAKQAAAGHLPVLEIGATIYNEKGPVLEMTDHMAVFLPAIAESSKSSISRMPLNKLVDCDMLADIVVTSVGSSTWHADALALRLSPQPREPVAPLLLSETEVEYVSEQDFIIALKDMGVTTIDRTLIHALSRVKDFATLLARVNLKLEVNFTDLVTFKRDDANFQIISVNKSYVGLSYRGGHMRFRDHTFYWQGTKRGWRYFESGLFDFITSKDKHYGDTCGRPISIEKLVNRPEKDIFRWY